MHNGMIFVLSCVGGILGMTLLGSLGGFFFKRSTSGATIWEIAKSKFVYIGVLFYLAGAVANILVLKQLPYSVVYPMSAITYVWSMVFSRLILKEKFTKQKLIGIVAILIGAVFFGMDGFAGLAK
ncbi:multidrug transporter [Ethanoligenens harbinense]|nr:multidrug transporter [Ethanoligenens harbinense YUAN-3]AYF38819.1 multidrug transporter [Ethanoligenens harbinense]AYF41569.1 multidrug transporter [Ethanoligenens harbinense]QCN92400.1 multidrug transporter [Ethanoligenens harbinense]